MTGCCGKATLRTAADDGCAVIVSLEAAPAESAIGLEVAPVSPVLAKPRVKVPAEPVSVRPVNDAAPFAAVAWVVVPLKAAPDPVAILATTFTPA